jgi:hypothetical protein
MTITNAGMILIRAGSKNVKAPVNAAVPLLNDALFS